MVRLFVSTLLLSVCVPVLAQSTGQQRAPLSTEGSKPASVEQWKNFEPARVESAGVDAGSVVVFRPLDAVPGGVANVYVGGQYHASLAPGSFTQFRACPDSVHMEVAYSNVESRYRAKTMAGQSVPVSAGKITYQVLSFQSGAIVAKEVSETEAAEFLRVMPLEQGNTISRVPNRACAIP